MKNKNFELLEEGRLDYAKQSIITGGGSLSCKTKGVDYYFVTGDGDSHCPKRYRSCTLANGRLVCAQKDGYEGPTGPAGYCDTDIDPFL